MKQFNRTYAEVNLDAIRHNIDEVHKNIKEGCKEKTDQDTEF